MSVKFKDIEKAKLIIDETYCGGTAPNMSSEVLNKLMLCSNSGGFRQVKNKDGKYAYCVLYTTGEDIDWKDYLDVELGRFIYYGDNKKEGHNIHNTSRKGNEILKECFEKLENNDRTNIIPFFIFQKVKGRDVRFLGLAIPGDDRLTKEEQLVSVWSQKDGKRYQNYKAVFSILDVSTIDRKWLEDLKNNIKDSQYAPDNWKKWIEEGKCKHLVTNKVVQYRKKEQQIPNKKEELDMIKEIYNYFDDAYKFEKCAAHIAQLMDKNIVSYDMTRTRRDGGRDAIGKYRIGIDKSNIQVEFAIEAKRYEINNSVGVKETSRLISRLKHREFGILVTTSYVDMQTYKEIVEDGHPIIIISAIDIVDILKKSGIKNSRDVKKWLESNFKNN
ncbi:MAG: restriction endonuclease [Clostridia bacterium]|nr:restriction endonuclease [Clostridia bacterium]